MKKKYFIIGLLVVFVSISSVFFYLNKQTTDIEYPGITYKGIDEDMISTIPDSNVEYLKNELILQLKNYEENYVGNLIKEYKGEIVGEIEATGTYQILFNQVEDFDKLNNIKLKLEKDENVDSIKFNKIYKVSEQGYYPNDEKWLDKWDDKNDLQTWGLRAIKAPEAWEYLKNRSVHEEETVEIGVFEVIGVDYLHEDLKDNFIEKPLGNSKSDLNHGTAVSGIIGAGFDNKIGIAGVIPKVKLRACGYHGIKDRFSTMTYKVAMAYLITNSQNKTAIINASLGIEEMQVAASYGNEVAINELEELNQDISDYLQLLLDKGYDFLICVGAGNTNETSADDEKANKIKEYIKTDENDKNSPYGYLCSNNKLSQKYLKRKDIDDRIVYGNVNAEYNIFSGIKDKNIKDRIIVVGSASTKDSEIIASSYSCAGNRVDIIAPGEDIFVLGQDNSYSSDCSGWGTSYSAPYVSGVAGITLSVNTNLTGPELKKIILDTATGSYTAYLNNESFEYKMVNAEDAVHKADRQLSEDEKKIMYNKYKNIILDKEKEIGEFELAPLKSYKDTYYMNNVCFEDLIDFDNDGNEELLLYYNKEMDKYGMPNYAFEVYRYNSETKSVDNMMSGNGYMSTNGGFQYVSLLEIEHKIYLHVDEDIGGASKQTFYELNNNKMITKIMFEYTYSRDNREYKINDKKVGFEEYDIQYKDWINQGIENNYLLSPCQVYNLSSESEFMKTVVRLNEVRDILELEHVDSSVENADITSNILGNWYSQEIDDRTAWKTSYKVEFREDNTVELSGWRFSDNGTYKISDANKIIADFNENYVSVPGTGKELIKEYKFTATFTYDAKTGGLSVEYSDEASGKNSMVAMNNETLKHE